MNSPLLAVHRLRHSFPESGFQLALDRLEIQAGESVALIGRSGCGKTTLLNLIAGIERLQEGSVHWSGERVDRLSERQRRDLRLERIGFVFQDFCLIDYLNLLDNILLPFRLSPHLPPSGTVRQRAAALAERVGLADRLHAPVRPLSQGEKQRVLICRSLVTEPSLVLADEATSNLDPGTRDQIQTTLSRYVTEHQAALLAVTHDRQSLDRYDRVVDLEAG